VPEDLATGIGSASDRGGSPFSDFEHEAMATKFDVQSSVTCDSSTPPLWG
jgi:hypothetical protein